MNNPSRFAVIGRAPCQVQLLVISSVDEPGSWTELVDGLRNPSDTSAYLISSKYSTSRLSPASPWRSPNQCPQPPGVV
jgi:hypothetical protein